MRTHCPGCPTMYEVDIASILVCQRCGSSVRHPKAKKIKEPAATYREYRRRVDVLTKRQQIQTLHNYELRGFRDHHLDHIVPVMWGWKHKLDPEVLAHILNLRFIPYRQNMNKGNFIHDYEAWRLVAQIRIVLLGGLSES